MSKCIKVFLLASALSLGFLSPSNAFEVTANIKASVVSDLSGATVYCYIYVLGRDPEKPEREDYGVDVAILSAQTLTCSPKVNYSLSELGAGLIPPNVQYKVVISAFGPNGSRQITPYYGPKVQPQNTVVLDLTKKSIKL